MNFFKGTIDDSIYRAAMAAGISESAFNDYIRVMGFSVDFQREIRTGDQFELLYETERDSIDGKVVGGKLHYAGLVLSDEQLGFFRYDSDKDTIGWYDENGNSAARTLIRTPISGARLSSSFGHRKHPVSGFNAMHKGVDFAAPRGTPIIAAGSGVIREAGWKGSFGRYIRIRHNATYDTAYAHMSRIAPNIRPGTRVKQGEIIGYVGSTGRSTGAHLHYEVMVNNRQVNPMTVRLPTGERIADQHLPAFQKTIAAIDQEVLSHGTVRFAGDLTIKNTQ
jgi:murein DD-endopeptidase MepM/ murein hydrolase activator NlpD